MAVSGSDHKVFISYSHRDDAFVERLRADIVQAELPVWIDYEGLQPGTDNWEKAIRAAIKSAESVVYVASQTAYESNYCQSELAVARAYNKKIYPVFSRGDDFVNCIPMGMTHVQFIDMRDETLYKAGLPRLLKALGVQQATAVEAIPAAEPEAAPAPPGFEPSNPYKALDAFTAEDRANFFGRSAFVRTLTEAVESLSDERFLALVGPSGAGKSSVAMAGLLPALADNHPDWLFLPPVLPGDRPLEALAVMLRGHLGGAISDYERDLGNPDMRGLVKYARALVNQNAKRVILFIDQFEELFTQTPPEREAERRQFIDVLTTATLDPKSQVIIILTLRADFTDRALAYEELTRLLQRHTQLVPPLSLADLREVIEEPARQQHLTFDPDLAADLVFAVRDQAGALPLLQFTLDQLYRHRDGLRLTRNAYINKIGELHGALAKHAEATYDALPGDTHRSLTRWLFLRLLEPGTTEKDTTRRRVARRDLVPSNAAEAAIAAEVIDAFIAARLLVAGERGTVEVAHEALLREWQRLVEWLHAYRTDLPIQKALATATAEWLNAGAKPDDERLAGPGRLRDLTDWATRNTPSENEDRYLRASRARQTELIALEERRKQDLLDLEKRAETAQHTANQAVKRASITGGVAGIAGGAAALAVVIAVVASVLAQQNVTQANQKAQAANAQAATSQMQIAAVNATLTPIPGTLTAVAQSVQANQNLNQSLQLAAQANVILQDQNADKLPAVLLGIRALKVAYSPQADAALVRALDSGYEKQWFRGHIGGVSSVAFSPDGKYVLTGSDDHTAHLWDASSGQSLRTFSGHTDRVLSVAFSPDGKYVLTGSDDHTAQLWDANSGQSLRTFSGHTDRVLSVAFSPDGKYVLTGSADHTARLWDTSSGQSLRTFRDPFTRVTSVAFSPDGSYILTVSAFGVMLWDANSGQRLRIFSGKTGDVTSVAFSPDGRYILMGNGDHTARLWDTSSGQSLRTFSGHTDRVLSVAFSPDGRYILTGSADHTARLWDASSGQSLRIFSGHADRVSSVMVSPDGRYVIGGMTSVAFSPDGKYVLTGSDDHTARLWEMGGGQSLRTFSGHIGGVLSVAFSPDGRYIVTGNGNTALLWDANSGLSLRIFNGNVVGGVLSVAFSPDGKYILTGSGDGAALLWDTSNGWGPGIAGGHGDFFVSSVTFSPDGKYILTGSADKTAQLWDANSDHGESLRAFSGHTDGVTSVAFSPDGKYVLTGSADKTARLWDANSGQSLRTFSSHIGGVSSVAFSPDGKYVLTGSYDHTAQLWDANSGQSLRTFSGHADRVSSVAFSPDGKYVLTGSYDHTAQLWDANNGQSLRIFSGHDDAVLGLAFSPDGKYVLTGSADSSVRIWDTDYRTFVIYACSQVWRDLTPDERQRFSIADNEPTCPQFANAVIEYSNVGTGTPTPILNGPITTAMPPTPTPFSVTLPMFTPIASPTVGPSDTPTETTTPTGTPTYPGVLLTFTPGPTAAQP